MLNCDQLKKSNKVVGVYCIFNVNNGRRYVGSSNHLWTRFTEHRRHLRNGIHENQFLQNDYQKCGGDSFLFFVLEKCSEDSRITIEQRWLDALYDNRVMCYNIEQEAKGRRAWNPSEETRKRMSLAKKGKSTGPCSDLRRVAIQKAKLGKPNAQTPEGKQRMIASKQKIYNIQLLAPDGTIYGPITNLHAFCREHKLDRASILRLMNGKQGRVGMWKLANPVRIDRRFKYVGEDYKTRKRK